MTTAASEAEVLYPTGDGKPMAETPIHVQAIFLLHQALEDLLLPADPDVFIASDIFWYYQRGRPSRRVSPDVMVVPGAGPGDRRAYLSWQERVPVPAAVFEMASRSTWRHDLNGKFQLYQRLGVPEYYVFDPEGRYIPRQLTGFRLRDGTYTTMRRVGGALVSGIGCRLRPDGEMLRVYDSNDRPIPTRAEAVASANLRATEAERRADDADRRAAEFQGELDRLRSMLRQQGRINGNGS